MDGRRLRSPLALLLLTLAVNLSAAQIDPANPYAWSETTGWINHRSSQGAVEVSADHLEGFAWSENIGWIKLGSHSGGGAHTYANSSAGDWGVNRAPSGNLSGYAWSESAGWINFAPTGGGVAISNGLFDGYAWGENIGWVHFRNPSPAYGVALEPLAVSVSMNGNGSGSVSGAGNYAPGTTVTLGAAAGPGSTFAGWSPSPCASGFVMPEVAVACTATFTLDSFPITVAAVPAPGGSITCSPNPVAYGGSSHCAASASAGYSFTGFSGDCTGTSCTLGAVSGPKNVIASFTLNSYTIATAANPPAGGSVSCTPNPVSHGGTATCSATANGGYTFAGFGGDCTGANCTLTNVTGVRNVVASFQTPAVPALNGWGLVALSGMVFGLGVLRRRRPE